tara:strand:- start:280 stop:501 length:222 start_codon:yes stop_codon:yes gene_type:complete
MKFVIKNPKGNFRELNYGTSKLKIDQPIKDVLDIQFALINKDYILKLTEGTTTSEITTSEIPKEHLVLYNEWF